MTWKITIRMALAFAMSATLVPELSAQDGIATVVAELRDGDLVVSTTPVSIPLPVRVEGEDRQHEVVYPPIVNVEFPVSGYMYGFEFELVDSTGQDVPSGVLHHFNVIDPEHREMFLPISRRVFAAGPETGPYKMPKTLIGIPFEAGDTFVLSAMLHNPTDQAYAGVTLRVRINIVKTGLPWPLAVAVPFQIDTLFPTGDKSFDLPSGKSSRSWEGQPVTEGRIVALGGHLHLYSTRLYLEDVTLGKVVWAGLPAYDETGNLLRITRGEYYGTSGILLEPDHTYRVTAEYDNTSGETVTAGGMGVIGGIVIPSDPGFGFQANEADSLYAIDYSHYMRESMTMNGDKENP
ncbi:MAG: hypothetical protein BMS9Abin05_0070 [Rhodothermia bacterium]|nr:MAG: hypothetical protein BMS9Abin05_0070 [Rhodothermia bacterium]